MARATRIAVACSLIAATALATLLMLVLDARAQTTDGASVVCPPDDRSQSSVPTQLRSGERKTLVPPGATTLIVCQYNGINAFGGAPRWGLLSAGATSNRAKVKRIVTGLDALKPTRAMRMCPMDDGSAVVATFGYRSAPGVVVTIETNGCNAITNGHVHRDGLGRFSMAQIEALAKPVMDRGWATVRGRLRLCGGPAPGRCYIENLDNHDRVIVTGSNGKWLATAAVNHGRFAFKIASPGTYTFGFYTGNTLVRKLRERVTLGKTTRVVFLIPIP
jgi:hypothetical protein